ncbi:MAG TPA: hypothetical protein VES62_14355 [Thermoleophilaceae bacterium]|nr:hypothetical protein [Thermoleophilaceae bacterium]
MLARDGDHLFGPGITDVPADDDQLREVERNLVDVWDRPPCLGRPQRPGVADLREERNIQLDARREERVVPAIRGRSLPQPRHDAQALEAQLGHAATKLAHRLHRLVEVDGGDSRKPVLVLADPAGHLVVAYQRRLIRR